MPVASKIIEIISVNIKFIHFIQRNKYRRLRQAICFYWLPGRGCVAAIGASTGADSGPSAGSVGFGPGFCGIPGATGAGLGGGLPGIGAGPALGGTPGAPGIPGGPAGGGGISALS